RGVQFIGVSIDSGGFASIEEFANEYGANYPLVLDDGSVYGVYRGSTGVPTTYIIDPMGRITKYWPGALSRSILMPELLAMLEA
ncbi:MAG: TlpA disulfide reductase family protein, partial [Acidobacteriota bacterium]|nr:TlpA disulfide reductase family protein [Acidobacteriota bacterium]